jgi:hypothetical protein
MTGRTERSRRIRASWWAALVLLAMPLAGCERPGMPIAEEVVQVSFGEDGVQIWIYEAATPGLEFINLHEDEATSVEATLDVMRRRGGRLLVVRQHGERTVRYVRGDSVYAFDPNRIFTPAGRQMQLARAGAEGEDVERALTQLADTLLALYGARDRALIVAVHNNWPGGYSATSYMPGQEHEAEARFVHLNEVELPDNFFLVTDFDLYTEMRTARFNVVLQDSARMTDDGSLSVWAAIQGIPYINVEAARGDFEAQVRMLEFVNKLAGNQVES